MKRIVMIVWFGMSVAYCFATFQAFYKNSPKHVTRNKVIVPSCKSYIGNSDDCISLKRESNTKTGEQKNTVTFNGQTLDSLISQGYDSTNTLQNSSKYEYSYDTSGNLVSKAYYAWSDTSHYWWTPHYYYWELKFRIEHTYDSAGNRIRTMNSWGNKSEFTYNTPGNLTSEINFDWILGPEPHWIPWYKKEYFYDTLENLTLFTEHRWDQYTNAWFGWNKFMYTYDTNNRLIMEIDQDWFINDWRNLWKTVYEYAENGTLSLKTEFVHDETYTSWVGNNKFEYTYDSTGNILLNVSFWWDKELNTWVYDTKEEYTHNQAGELMMLINLFWDQYTEGWYGSNKYLYTYNESGDKTSEIHYFRNGNTNQWEEYTKTDNTYDDFYSYEDLILPDQDDIIYPLMISEVNGMSVLFNHMLTGVTVSFFLDSSWISRNFVTYYFSDNAYTDIAQLSHNSIFSVYPNPAINKITIENKSQLANEFLVRIFNINGEVLKQDKFKNQDKIEIDVSKLVKGVYVVKIETGEGVESEKLVIQ